MNDQQWNLISSETVYETASKGLRVQKRLYKCEDGRTKAIELKDEGPFGHAFALTPDNKVILVRQFRPGPDKYFYESPAGKLDKGTDSKLEVLRELKEETGYTTNEIMPLYEGYDGPYTTARRYMYIALNCKKIHEVSLDEDELIEDTLLVSIDDFKHLLVSGQYTYPLLGYLALMQLGFNPLP